jgi:hypothetical protein
MRKIKVFDLLCMVGKGFGSYNEDLQIRLFPEFQDRKFYDVSTSLAQAGAPEVLKRSF